MCIGLNNGLLKDFYYQKKQEKVVHYYQKLDQLTNNKSENDSKVSAVLISMRDADNISFIQTTSDWSLDEVSANCVSNMQASELRHRLMQYILVWDRMDTVTTLKQGERYKILKYYDPSITEDVVNMFSEVLQETYKRFGIDFNSDFTRFKSNDFPTFSDVYTTIKGKLMSMTEKTQERNVMEILELKVRPIINELRYYFDGHTTISPTTNFIVFNIRELMNADTNIRNALFFNILKYAWSLTLDKSVDTILTVDEAHVLLGSNNSLGAEFLAQIQRRARKYNTGTIIITQQPSDFTDPAVITQGKAIFDNASYYLVMGLKKQAVEDLSKLIDLNENEKDSIKRYSQGEALFVCGNRRMRINIIVTDEELDSFGEGGGL